MEQQISLDDIQQAHERIQPHIHRTPILVSHTVNDIVGATVFFKCENFQKIGAFKARGGVNAVLQVVANNEAKAITTHSSGNHAQAVAFSAKLVGLPAYIVMPKNAPQVKKDAVKGYGARVIECEPNLAAREQGVADVIAGTGAVLVHPFDNDWVIAGQGTAVKELLEDAANDAAFNAIFTPVGGGGLLSGTSLAVHYLSPQTKVFGCEPEGAADAVLSFKSGQVEQAPYIKSVADGLLTTLSPRTLGIIRSHVSDIFTVSEDEIISAMKLIWERMKIVVEPSSAVALAAVIKNKDRFAGQKLGIIITGGNVDMSKLPFN